MKKRHYSKNIFLDFFNINSGEGYPVFFLFMNTFFSGMLLSFFYTAAAAMFLALFRQNTKIWLPVAYIASAVLGFLTSLLYRWLERKNAGYRLYIAGIFFLMLSVGGLSLGIQAVSSPVLIFLIFIWFRVIQYITNVQHWGIAGRLLNLRQGKRLFAFTSAGGVISGILSSFSIPILLSNNLLETKHLFLLCALILFIWVLFLSWHLRNFRKEFSSDSVSESETGAMKPPQEKTGLFANRYTSLIFIMAVLPLFGLYYIDYIFLDLTREVMAEKTASFIAIFFGVVKIVDLLMKTFISGALLNRFGLRLGLLLLPAVLFISTSVGAFVGTTSPELTLLFMMIVVSKLFDRVLRTSVSDPSFQILFQPIPAARRSSFQARVEGIPKQLGIGVVGISLLLFGLSSFFNTVKIIYILLFLLMVWLMIARLMYREYRSYLMKLIESHAENQASEKSELVEFETVISESVQSGDRNKPRLLFSILLKIDPLRLEFYLKKLLKSPEPKIRRLAIQEIKQLNFMLLLPAIELQLERETDESVRLKLEKLAKSFNAVLERNSDRRQLEKLIHSSKSDNRILGTQLIGLLKQKENGLFIWSLLGDHDPEVVKWTVASVARVKIPQLYSRLVEMLMHPRLGFVASSALIRGGKKVLPYLDLYFNKSDLGSENIRRQIYVYQNIDPLAAGRLFWKQIDFPDDAMQTQILEIMSQNGQPLEDDDRIKLENKIEQAVENIIWNTAALLDIQENRLTRPLVENLNRQIARNKERLFLLLSVLHEPKSIRNIQQKIETGTSQEKIFALESLDVLLSRELNDLLSPVFEELKLNQRLRRLENQFPQQQLSGVERLKDIVNQDGAKSDCQTKAWALESLVSLGPDEAPAELKANLYHPDYLLQETAARGIYQIDPGEFKRRMLYLDEKQQIHFQRLLPDSADPIEASRFIMEKIKYLMQIPIFDDLTELELRALAMNLDPVEYQAKEQILPGKTSIPRICFLVEGKVQVVHKHCGSAVLESKDILGGLNFLSEEMHQLSAVALETTRCYVLNAEIFFQLIANKVTFQNSFSFLEKAITCHNRIFHENPKE